MNTPRATIETAEPSPNATMTRKTFVGMAIGASALALSDGVHSIAIADEAKPYDLLIKGGNVYSTEGTEEGIDLGIRDGYIVDTGSLDEADAAEVVDATGKLVSPSFVDTHTHLDKAFQMEYPEYVNRIRELAAEFDAGDEVDYGYPVCGGSESYLMELIDEQGGEDAAREVIEYRLRKALDMAIVNGTCCIKTNNT